jgi:para-nitrobenzyl esterase
MKSLLVSAALALSLATAASAASPNPVVSVTGGQIEGQLVTNGGATFKGVPFAAAPVGDLRWKAPQPVKAWSGARDASKFGASCVQNVVEWNRQEATGNKEDCLYLNIWTPQWPVTGKKAVMFWIHGGGNTGGGASVDYFDGASLASKDVVVVTINYRLGLYGFFAHPELTKESPNHASGNYALLDQVAALKWVRDNIAKFGGDPNNVTVFGQSAGATDTGLLLTTPLSKGLFQRAIQQSGAPIRLMKQFGAAEQEGVKFGAKVGAPTLAALRAMDAQELLKLSNDSPAGSKPTIEPIIDRYSMPASAQQIFAAGKQHNVPLLMGSNAQEQSGPKPEELRQNVADFYGVNTQKALAYYGLDKPGNGNVDAVYGPAGKQIDTDTRRRCLTIQEATWMNKIGATAYAYEFMPPIAGRPATQHSAELPFVFGTLLPAGFLGGPFTANDKKVSEYTQVYWTNFAKKGDPNGPGVPAWPKFDPAKRAYMELAASGPVSKSQLRADICNLFMDNLTQVIAKGDPA